MSIQALGLRLKELAHTAINEDVKLARGMAHAEFDLIWKRKLMTRRQAYAWLQKTMDLTEPQAHMEQMDAQQCMQVIAAVKKEFPCLR